MHSLGVAVYWLTVIAWGTCVCENAIQGLGSFPTHLEQMKMSKGTCVRRPEETQIPNPIFYLIKWLTRHLLPGCVSVWQLNGIYLSLIDSVLRHSRDSSNPAAAQCTSMLLALLVAYFFCKSHGTGPSTFKFVTHASSNSCNTKPSSCERSEQDGYSGTGLEVDASTARPHEKPELSEDDRMNYNAMAVVGGDLLCSEEGKRLMKEEAREKSVTFGDVATQWDQDVTEEENIILSTKQQTSAKTGFSSRKHTDENLSQQEKEIPDRGDRQPVLHEALSIKQLAKTLRCVTSTDSLSSDVQKVPGEGTLHDRLLKENIYNVIHPHRGKMALVFPLAGNDPPRNMFGPQARREAVGQQGAEGRGGRDGELSRDQGSIGNVQDMRFEYSRLASFKELSPSSPLSPIRMAEAGWSLTGRGDQTECFHCHVRYSGWRAEQCPLEVHQELSPHCGFLQHPHGNNVPILNSQNASLCRQGVCRLEGSSSCRTIGAILASAGARNVGSRTGPRQREQVRPGTARQSAPSNIPTDSRPPSTPSSQPSPSLPHFPSSPSVPHLPPSPSLPRLPPSPSLPHFPSSPSVPHLPASPSVPHLPSSPSPPRQTSSPSLPRQPPFPILPRQPPSPSFPGNPPSTDSPGHPSSQSLAIQSPPFPSLPVQPLLPSLPPLPSCPFLPPPSSVSMSVVTAGRMHLFPHPQFPPVPPPPQPALTAPLSGSDAELFADGPEETQRATPAGRETATPHSDVSGSPTPAQCDSATRAGDTVRDSVAGTTGGPTHGPGGQGAIRGSGGALAQRSGPSHPGYTSLERRLASFANWGSASRQPAEELARLGFFYAGFADAVRCHWCGLGLKDWSDDDNPLHEHVRWRSSCDHLRSLVPEREIFAILAQFTRQMADEESEEEYTEEELSNLSPADFGVRMPPKPQ